MRELLLKFIKPFFKAIERAFERTGWLTSTTQHRQNQIKNGSARRMSRICVRVFVQPCVCMCEYGWHKRWTLARVQRWRVFVENCAAKPQCVMADWLVLMMKMRWAVLWSFTKSAKCCPATITATTMWTKNAASRAIRQNIRLAHHRIICSDTFSRKIQYVCVWCCWKNLLPFQLLWLDTKTDLFEQSLFPATQRHSQSSMCARMRMLSSIYWEWIYVWTHGGIWRHIVCSCVCCVIRA